MDRLKHTFTNMTKNFHERDKPVKNPQDAQIHHISSNSRLAWPPKLIHPPRLLGEVKDISGRQYPRDIGRSFHLGGHVYYIFGDTFCFNSTGEFVGVTNNTIARIPNLDDPIRSQYPHPEAKVPEFVPHLREEKTFCEEPENQKENKRIVTWSFGGVIEVPGSAGREGWLICDPVETHGGNAVKQNGVGIAKARVTGPDGKIECERVGEYPLFPGDGPIWGNMSNIAAPDGWTYLLSGKGLDNYMARIRTDADFTDRGNYEFLKKSGKWERTYTEPYGPFGELVRIACEKFIYVPHNIRFS